MLKLTYDLEKDNRWFFEEENEVYKLKNEQLIKQLDATKHLVETKMKEIDKLWESGYKGVMKESWSVDKTDADSEFSYATEEPGLRPEENILDLAVDNAEFYADMLWQEVDLVDFTQKSFATFMTVEFYDHDTKVTDVVEGYTPNYATQFSFKNAVDDFYIKYLETKSVKLEIFITKAAKAEPLGFVTIPLNDLIISDSKLTSGSKSAVVHNTGYIVSAKDPSRKLGMIRFKLRMRKTLAEALKWYKEKQALDAVNSEKIVDNL